MNANFLLVIWSCLFYKLSHASVVQELIEQKLNPKGVVQSGSMTYYNPDDATWTFKLNLCHPGKSDEQNIDFGFRLELTEKVSYEEVTNCAVHIHKPFDSTQRQVYISYYEMLNETSTCVNNTSVTFDHVYSGNYMLEIKCCEDGEISCNSCQNSYTKYDDLLPVKTKLNRVNIDCMNISIRVSEAEGGIDVDFSVNYYSNPPFLEFKEFEVTISQKSKQLRSQISYSTHMRFKMNFTEMTKESCNKSDSNSIKTPEVKRALCSDLSLYYSFIVVVHPLDSRCNYPTQIYADHREPCKRYIQKKLQIFSSEGEDGGRDKQVSSPLSYIWIPVLVVALSTCVAMLYYIKRKNVLNRNKVNFTISEVKKQSSRHKILLVYDMNDEAMINRAAILRQLIDHCVYTVYDISDPQQEENINIMGQSHWFSTHINNSNVCIVVIQSSGLIQCFEELLRVDRVNDVVPVQDNDLLLFVLHQLLSITSTSSDSLYDRIFVTTHSDLECTVHSYLTPFRCYNMPEHLVQLLTDLSASTE